MTYFTKDFIDFFKELEKNNNREWFNEQKKRYEKSVKKPFEKCVGDILEALSDIEGPYPIQPKDAIFRIYRDVRFSKDKSPYKTQASALITKMGRKGMSEPGMYIEASNKHVRFYGGLYEVPREKLNGLRLYLATNYDTFTVLLERVDFKQMFGEIRGEKNKRLPPELTELAEESPLIYHKSYYFFTEWPAKTLLEEGLVQKIMHAYAVSNDLRQFLLEGLED